MPLNKESKPNQILPPRAKVDLRGMAMKVYSTFPKPTALLEPHHQIVSIISRILV